MKYEKPRWSRYIVLTLTRIRLSFHNRFVSTRRFDNREIFLKGRLKRKRDSTAWPIFDSIHELAHSSSLHFHIFLYNNIVYHSCLCYNTAKLNSSNEIQ